MKLNYTHAEMQIIALPKEDVIRTSQLNVSASCKFGSGDLGRSDGLQDVVG